MRKIDIATDLNLNGINKLRENIGEYIGNDNLILYDILKSQNRITFVIREFSEIVAYLILHCSMSFINDEYAEFEFGVHPKHQKQGLGTSLVECAIEYIKNETFLVRLDAKIKKGNSKSERLLRNRFGLKGEPGILGTYLTKDIQR